MRLALVRRRYDACGGAELYLVRLIEALAATGQRPEIVTESWPEPPPGVRLHRVTVTGDRTKRLQQFLRGAEQVIEREQFDCVISLERGVRADVYRAGDGVHAAWIANWRRWGRWWKRLLAGRGAFHSALLRADICSFDPSRTRRVIVNSEMVRGQVRARFRFPDDRLHLVRNGIELELFRGGDRRHFRERWAVPQDACLLLFAGSGWERKGLAWTRHALARLPSDRFILVVAGRGHVPWRRRRNELYVGPLPRPDMPHALAAADVFVFPTLYDPSSNACIEALAAGRPVITTSQNGAAELIEEGVNGNVVTCPADTAALAHAISAWAGRGSLLPVRTSADMSLTRNVNETLAVIELAMHNRRH